MLQGEHSAILLTFIKQPFVIKIFDMSIFEWPFKTGFTELLLTLRAVNVLIVLAPQFWMSVLGITSRALATAL